MGEGSSCSETNTPHPPDYAKLRRGAANPSPRRSRELDTALNSGWVNEKPN